MISVIKSIYLMKVESNRVLNKEQKEWLTARSIVMR